eukprot:5253696-Alexandrium_andersonii.AAC.1
MLLASCRELQLRVASTYFMKPDRKKVTFRAPGAPILSQDVRWLHAQHYADLDHCLVPARWKGIVLDISSDMMANVQSDHFPLIITLR